MPYGIAIDLGATHTRVGLIDESGEILKRISAPTPHVEIPYFLISLIRKTASTDELLKAAGIGISAAGPVDVKKGLLVNPPNLPFRNIPLVEPLYKAFGMPVRLANDCHAGVLGEVYFGGLGQKENLAYVTLSTGIGGGILAEGRLLLGREGNAAEIGHFLVDTTYSMRCGCGYPGHWEAYASGRFLPSFFTRWCEHHHKQVPRIFQTAEEIFQAAREGEIITEEFLETLGRINGRGMSDVIVAYDPALIVLDGSVALNNYSLLVPPMEEHIDRFLPLPEIRLSSLAGDAPLLGASVLARGCVTNIGSLQYG
jgi:glucokinase